MSFIIVSTHFRLSNLYSDSPCAHWHIQLLYRPASKCDLDIVSSREVFSFGCNAEDVPENDDRQPRAGGETSRIQSTIDIVVVSMCQMQGMNHDSNCLLTAEFSTV